MAAGRVSEDRRSTGVLLVAGTVFSNALLVCFWLWWAFGTHNGFADMSVDMLKDPYVRGVVADQIVDAMKEQGMTQQVALAAGPALKPVVAEMVGTYAFKGLFYAGARQLHETVFLGAKTPMAVRVDDAAPMVKDSLQVVNPELADKIPDSALDIAVGLSNNRQLDLAIRSAALAGWMLWPLGALTLASFGVAVMLSRDRRRTWLRVGLGLASSGLFWIVVLVVSVAVVSRMVDGADDRAALRAVFRSLTHVLMLTARVVLNAGVVITLAALVAGEERVRAKVRQAIEWARVRWNRPRLHGILGALILVVGVLVAVYPEVMLAVVARFIGLVVAFIGLVAVFDVAGAHGWARAGDGRESSTLRRVAVFSVGACATVAVLLGFGGFALYRAMHTTKAASADPDRRGCNHHIELCDRRLDQVVLAGSHNSMSASAEPGWFFARQTGGIGAQLAKGVRAFLIDAHYGFRIGGIVRTDFASTADASEALGELSPQAHEQLDRTLALVGSAKPPGVRSEVYFCHVYCELGASKAESIFEKIDGFLRENPNEVVLLVIEDHVSPADLQAAVERSGLDRRALALRPGEQLPTLRQMILSKHNVLITTEKAPGAEAWLPMAYGGLLEDTPYKFETVADFTCGAGRGQAKSTLLLVNHWLATDPASPAVARTANSRTVLMDRVDDCRAARGRLPNVIAVDFYASGDLFSVVDELNGVTRGVG